MSQMYDFFFVQHYDVFLQVAGVFSKLGARACTNRSDPDSCRLTCGTAQFRPVECKQLSMNVSCVSVHSRCISLHMAGAYTLSFLETRGGPCNPVCVALDSPTTMFKDCILQPDVSCYISPVRRNRKFESNVQLVGVVFGSLLCTTEARNVQVNLLLFPHWFSSICWRAKTDDEDDVPSIFSSDSASDDAQQSMKSSKIKLYHQSSVSGTATRRS